VNLTGIEWVMNLHDYEVICPRINLVDRDGLYCGEPRDEACDKCLKLVGSDFEIHSIKNWRDLHGEALRAASSVIVPDEDVSTRLIRYFPEVAIVIKPHEMLEQPQWLAGHQLLTSDEPLRVVVIGAISKIK